MKPWNPSADTSAQFLATLAHPGDRRIFTGQPGDPMLRPRCACCGHYLSDGTLGGIGRLGDGYRGQAWCERCIRNADEASLAAAGVPCVVEAQAASILDKGNLPDAAAIEEALTDDPPLFWPDVGNPAVARLALTAPESEVSP